MTIEDLEKQYSAQLEQLRTQLREQIPSDISNDADKLDQFLSSSHALDDKLVQYVMLYEATPKGLAEFASQDSANAALIQELLGNTTLLKEMILADSPKVPLRGRDNFNKWSPALYGPAMKIYKDILEVSEHATSKGAEEGGIGSAGILGRLALAVALEHADPMPQENPKTPPPDAEYDDHVDPIRRYLNYEMAFLEGELDPAFELLTTFELRFVVDGSEPDETLAWGREMLKNYRPDNILMNGQQNNYAWKYSNMVRSNVRYGSGDVKYDKPELQLYQNILMNGGVCGRRAFFGRFILRAFGIPTAARPSRGHGALCHWTPNEGSGWVVNLGGNFGCGWTKTRYGNCQDFLRTTQARNNAEAYWKVKRAQWFGDVMQEKRIYGEHSEAERGFWYGKSLEIQKAVVDAFPNRKVPPRTLQKANHKPTLAEKVQAAKIPPSEITMSEDGVITIPADAFMNPRKTKDVHVMKSFLFGGRQIYLPDFKAQGLSVLRSSTWKSGPEDCRSGFRLKSGGYGQYHDWGFRMAMEGPDGSTCPAKGATMTVELGDDPNGKKIAMEFVFIQPGTFVMGGENETDDRFRCVEVPKHQVTLTKGFWLGKYPVTQAQFEVLLGRNPSKAIKNPDCPVDNVGEGDALEYCDKMVETIGKDFRLPTEAEWEYAARAGSDTKFFFGDDESQLGEYAWFKGNSEGRSHPVGQKKPNPFGLYDIIGNNLERCSDRYAKDYYAKSPSVDPTGPLDGTHSTFEYQIKNVPKAGSYLLETEVVTANAKQRINVTVNGDESSTTTIHMPCTNGYWQDSEVVTISLREGENTLKFWRDKPPQLGVAIKGFTIRPAS